MEGQVLDHFLTVSDGLGPFSDGLGPVSDGFGRFHTVSDGFGPTVSEHFRVIFGEFRTKINCPKTAVFLGSYEREKMGNALGLGQIGIWFVKYVAFYVIFL